MKMMGLPSWLHWVGWFVITILTTLVTISVMVIVLVVWEIFPRTNALILFITIFLYSLATICFNFAQSTLLSNPNLSVALGIILHFGTWIPGAFITQENYFLFSKGIKMLIATVPNMGIMFTYFLVVFKEEQAGDGLTWSEVNRPANASDNITILDLWGSNIICCLLSMIFLWYMDNVRPGKFGVAKKLWFPFQKSYWCGDRVDQGYSGEKLDLLDKQRFEEEPSKEKGVEVSELLIHCPTVRTYFPGKKSAKSVQGHEHGGGSGQRHLQRLQGGDHRSPGSQRSRQDSSNDELTCMEKIYATC